MSEIEDQVRRYAEALEVDRPVPLRAVTVRPNRESSTHRAAFLVAVAALVLIVVAAAAMALRAGSGPDPARVDEPPTTATSTVETSEVEAPSQSATDAARDGVVPEVAELPTSARVRELAGVDVPEGRWVLSRPNWTNREPDQMQIGDTAGVRGTDWIDLSTYAEFLLLDPAGRIQRAYPMPLLPPSWLTVAGPYVYGGRIGDGALPATSWVRINRASGALELVAFQPDDWQELDLLPGWRFGDEAERALSTAAVTVGPDPTQGQVPVVSIIGPVAVNLEQLATLFGN